MGLSFLRFAFLFWLFPAYLFFLPVHVVKREGRLKPTTTAQNF